VHLGKNLGVDRWKARLAHARTLDVGGLWRHFAATAVALWRSLGNFLPAATRPKEDDGGRPRMTREEALTALGLRPGASEREIDAALEEEVRRRGRPETGQRGGKKLNGADQATLDAARETLRGKVP